MFSYQGGSSYSNFNKLFFFVFNFICWNSVYFRLNLYLRHHIVLNTSPTLSWRVGLAKTNTCLWLENNFSSFDQLSSMFFHKSFSIFEHVNLVHTEPRACVVLTTQYMRSSINEHSHQLQHTFITNTQTHTQSRTHRKEQLACGCPAS